MVKNYSKIYQRAAFMILAIIISGLLNICLFSFQAKAAPIQPLKLNFTYDNSSDCVAESKPEPTQTINHPSAPMSECCLAKNRYYEAVVNTASNESAPIFTNLVILPLSNLNLKNNSTYHIPQSTSPPLAELALASTVIRE